MDRTKKSAHRATSSEAKATARDNSARALTERRERDAKRKASVAEKREAAEAKNADEVEEDEEDEDWEDVLAQVYIAIHDGDADTYLRILKSDKVYKDDLRELLEHAARVFFDGGNRDGSALEALKEHGADVAECLNMAIAFRHTSIYMPLITHFEFDQEELQEFLHTVFCDGYDDSTSDETDEIIKCLVHKGLDFQKEGPHEEIPLVYAIKQGRLGVAETLLRAGATPNNVSDEVLEHAARFIDGSMVKLLIERGADVNIDSESEGTALHHIAVKAVALNDTRCLKLFMEAGAKERSATNDRYELTPMEYIQKEYGEDPTKARALNRAVDLLASFRKQ